jgi:hypothetical protein
MDERLAILLATSSRMSYGSWSNAATIAPPSSLDGSFCRPGLTASGSPRSMRYAQMPCASGSSLRPQSRSCVAIYLPTARSRSIHGLDGDEQQMNPLFEVEYRSWSRRTGAPEASATRRDRSPPVHGGYTRSRRVTERNGHERSPRELRNRSSARQRSPTRHTFRRRARVRVSLPWLPQALRTLAHEAVVTEQASAFSRYRAYVRIVADDPAPLTIAEAAVFTAARPRGEPDES